MEGRGAKITEHGHTLATMQDVVGVEIAVIDALRVQVAGHRGDSPGDAQSRIRGEQGIRGVHVTGAGLEAGRPGEAAEARVDQGHHQPVPFCRMICDAAQHRDQVGVIARPQAHRHLVEGQAVTGHRALEQLHRHIPAAGTVPPGGPMDHPGGALPQHLLQGQGMPGHRIGPICPLRSLLHRCAEGVAGIGQPRQAGQTQQPAGQPGELIGGDAQQFEPGARGQLRRQLAKAVAGQHQFLQPGAAPDGGRQHLDLVVGEDQPAQTGWQRLGRHPFNLARLEAHHLQLRAAPQHLGQRPEGIPRAEQDAQPVQTRQIVRQRAQLIAGKVEHFQGIGEIEDLPGKLAQAGTQAQLPRTVQAPGAQVFKGMHGRRGKSAKECRFYCDPLSTSATSPFRGADRTRLRATRARVSRSS